MAELWRTRDRFGRVVTFTSASLDHVQERHDEITDRLDDVRITVEQPDFVTRDRLRAHRECFYRRELSGQGWIKVVVHYRPVPPQGTWAGEVITAYHVDQNPSKEATLWP